MRLINADALQNEYKKEHGKRLLLIDVAPTIEEHKTGRWILKDLKWECDQCGCRIRRAKPFSGNMWNYYYCPNCGADMRGEGNG